MTPEILSNSKAGQRITLSLVSKASNRFNKGRGKNKNLLFDRVTIAKTITGTIASDDTYRRLMSERLGYAYQPRQTGFTPVHGVKFDAKVAGNQSRLIALVSVKTVSEAVLVEGIPATTEQLDYLASYRKAKGAPRTPEQLAMASIGYRRVSYDSIVFEVNA